MFTAFCIGAALIVLSLGALVHSHDVPRSRFSRY